MSQPIVERSALYLIKILAVFCQFFSLIVITHSLSGRDLSDVFVAMSVGGILGSLIDLGYIRYSFRILMREGPVVVVLSRVATVVTFGFVAATVPLLIYAVFAGTSPILLELALMAFTVGQLVNIPRYRLLVGHRTMSAFLIEAVQPASFLLGIGAAELCGLLASTAVVIVTLFLSQLCALAAGILVTRDGREWAFVFHPRNFAPSLGKLKLAWIAGRRSAPVGAEGLISTLWFNALPALANLLYPPAIVSALGIFQRLLNVVRTFVGVSVTASLRRMYAHGYDRRETFKVLLASCIATSVGLASCLLFAHLGSFLNRSMLLGSFVGYVQMLTTVPIGVAVSGGFYIAFQHLSFAALAAGRHALRLWAVISAATVTVVVIAVGFLSGVEPIRTGVWSQAISTLLAVGILVCALSGRRKKSEPSNGRANKLP